MIFKNDFQRVRVITSKPFFPKVREIQKISSSGLVGMPTYTKPYLTSKNSMKTIPESLTEKTRWIYDRLWYSIRRGRGVLSAPLARCHRDPRSKSSAICHDGGAWNQEIVNKLQNETLVMLTKWFQRMLLKLYT